MKVAEQRRTKKALQRVSKLSKALDLLKNEKVLSSEGVAVLRGQISDAQVQLVKNLVKDK